MKKHALLAVGLLFVAWAVSDGLLGFTRSSIFTRGQNIERWEDQLAKDRGTMSELDAKVLALGKRTDLRPVEQDQYTQSRRSLDQKADELSRSSDMIMRERGARAMQIIVDGALALLGLSLIVMRGRWGGAGLQVPTRKREAWLS